MNSNPRIALVTGCNGFCGQHLIRRLADEMNIRIVGISRRQEPSLNGCVVECVKADVGDQGQVEALVSRYRPDFVFHLAALAEGAAADVYRTNFLATSYLLDALRRNAPEARILLVGSAAEYGNVSPGALPITEDHPCVPASDYAASKYAMTLLGREYAGRFKMKVVIARPFNIVGPGAPANVIVGAVLGRVKSALLIDREPVVEIGNLESARDFIAVEDVTDAYLRMVQGESWGEVFNLCSGNPISVRTVIETLFSNSSRPIRLITQPSLLRLSDPSIIYGDSEKARKAFGFRPNVPLGESLRLAWQYEMKG